jgi:hypothetical protein
MRKSRSHVRRLGHIPLASGDARFLTTRYEHLYAEPDLWLDAVVGHLAMPLTERDISRASQVLVLRRTLVDTSQHHRDGSPGNGRAALSRGVLAVLERRYSRQIEAVSAIPIPWEGNPSSLQVSLARLRLAIEELAAENGFRIAECQNLRQELEDLKRRLHLDESGAGKHPDKRGAGPAAP